MITHTNNYSPSTSTGVRGFQRWHSCTSKEETRDFSNRHGNGFVDKHLVMKAPHINFATTAFSGGKNFTNEKATALSKVNQVMDFKSHPLSNKTSQENHLVMPGASQLGRTVEKMEMSGKLLTESEMAEFVSVNKRTMRRFRKRKMIPFIRLGRLIRYDQQEVARALKAFRVGGSDK